MNARGPPSTAFEQHATAVRDTGKDQLRRSSRIRGKNADLSKLPNIDDNMDHKKVFCSALSKHEKDTRDRTNWKDFRVVWRDENPYKPLIKELLLIQV
jgi:hypothetical protein